MTTTALSEQIANAGRAAAKWGSQRAKLLEQTFGEALRVFDKLLGEGYSVLSPVQDKGLFDIKNMLERPHPDFANQARNKIRYVYWKRGDGHVHRLALHVLPANQGRAFVALRLSAEPTAEGVTLYLGTEQRPVELPAHAWENPSSETANVSRDKIERMVEAELRKLAEQIASVDVGSYYCFNVYKARAEIRLPDEPTAAGQSQVATQGPTFAMQSVRVVWQDEG